MVRKLGVVCCLLIAISALSLMSVRSTLAQGETCFGQPATIVSDIPGAVVQGTGGQDVIFTDFDDAAQTIYGYGGNDLICSGYGDVVYGGSGADSIFGFDVDAIYGESGTDFIVAIIANLASGGSGNDTFEAISVDTCNGGSGTDSFTVNDCTNVISIP